MRRQLDIMNQDLDLEEEKLANEILKESRKRSAMSRKDIKDFYGFAQIDETDLKWAEKAYDASEFAKKRLEEMSRKGS